MNQVSEAMPEEELLASAQVLFSALMGAVGVIALLANIACLLLSRHRKDNLNMSSVWLCSRNDIIANTSVLVAASLVFLTHSVLPDLAVGFLLTVVFAQSAGKVLSQSWREMHLS